MIYTWLLFDADGTLFDYDKAEASALRSTFIQVTGSFDERYATEYRRINHQMWIDFEQGKITADLLHLKRFELLLAAFELEADAGQFGARYLANLAASSQLIPGAEQLVKELAGRYRLMIITNGLSDVQRPRLARSAINGCFENIVISQEVGSAKPDSHIFDVAFQRMGQPAKHEVLIIGDSLTSDMRGGYRYGIDTCWYNPGGKAPDPASPVSYEITDLRQLLDILS
jgi:2-haloacid dehalogenase